MPAGPWVAADDLLADVAARLGRPPGTPPDDNWPTLAPTAIQAGRVRLLTVLGGRGYTAGQLDGWIGRGSYNRRYAAAYAFRFGAFAAAYDPHAIDAELEAIDRELTADPFALVGDNGEIILPGSPAAPVAGAGRLTGFDADSELVTPW